MSRSHFRQLHRLSFDPLSLFAGAQAGAWYDPSDFSTMFQDTAGTTPVTATGQSVARINDKSGNGHNLLQGVAGVRPTLQIANGKYYLNFDGVDDFLQSTGWSAMAQPIDRLCALQQDTWSANRYILDGGVADDMILRQNGVTPQLAIYSGVAAGTNGAATLGTPWYVAERFNGATSGLTINSTAVTGDAGTSGTTGLTVGARASGTTFCPIRLFGLIVRAGTMSAAELANAKAYLSAKAGI